MTGMSKPNENGQTTAEYGLVLSLVVMAVVIAVGVLGANVLDWWIAIQDAWPG